jgi:hypothetical protein
MSRGRSLAVALSATVTVALAAGAASAEEHPLVFAVVVGNNDGLGVLPQLHYADDDALRFYRLAVQLASEQNVALLTELDVDTWRRIQVVGSRPPPFLPPTKKKLIEVVGLFKRQIAKARADRPGRPVHFYFFFSGHGERGYFFLKGEGGARVDSAFTGADLEKAFADSRATLNGLFIDACKSQSLFVPKGPPLADDELGPDFSGLISKLDRSARLSPIGVLTSTVSNQPAGEARDIQGGYFSHVLTSGLSGAADANSDGIVRYGELAAFVSFHTRRIAGQRPWFRAPSGRMDAPLVSLKERKDLLEILPGIKGHFAIFDGGGHNLLLELHKTDAQWSRVILAPGRYRVIWVQAAGRGRLAQVEVGRGAQRLMQGDFTSAIRFGSVVVPKGEGLGAPPEPEETADMALRAFDPTASGFDQALTPRVVSALVDAYDAGRFAAVPEETVVSPPPPPPRYPRGRHMISAGWGLFSPPAEPLSAGQGVTFGYALHLRRPFVLGVRALFAFSDHTRPDPSHEPSFRMWRLALQAEASLARPLLHWLEVSGGIYLGWQAALITMDELRRRVETDERVTRLVGDGAGFRAGFQASLRASLAAGVFVAITAAWGAELLHQGEGEGREAVWFLRPQAYLQLGYEF